VTLVTDPELLAELNQSNGSKSSRVTDPQLLAELNGTNSSTQPLNPYSEATGWPSVRQDILNEVSSAPRETLAAVPEIIKGGYHAGKQTITNPLRAIGNLLGAGPLELTKQSLNVGPRALNYLAEKGIISEPYPGAYKRTMIGETGLKQKLFGEEQPGDEFLESLPPWILSRGFLGAGLTKAIPTAAGISKLQGGNAVTGALLAGAGKGIGKAAEGIKSEVGRHSELKELKKAIESVEGTPQENLYRTQLETGEVSSKSLHNKISKNQQELQDLTKEIEENPNVPHLDLAEKFYNESREALNQSEDQLNKILGEGLTHNEHIARMIYEPQKAIENEISNEYKAIDNDLKNVKVPVQTTASLSRLEKDLRKIAPNATDAELGNLLNKTAEQLGMDVKNKTISASDFLNQWRSVRDKGYELIDATKKESDAVKRQEYYKQGQEAFKAADKLFEIMKDNFPPEVFGRLLANNERFVNEIIPLRYNQVWQQIEKNRKISGKDLIEKLGGEGPGQEILRRHIQSNPRASELMLGSRMAQKPEYWHKAHEASIPYFENISPETRSLLEAHHEASKNFPMAQKIMKRVAPERERKLQLQEKSNDLIKQLDKDKKNLEKLKSSEKNIKDNERIRELEKRIKVTKSKLMDMALKGTIAATGFNFLSKLFG
jgi:hypothetical protein